MPAIVNKVEENSIAQELEIESGDKLLSIDDKKIADLIEYNFLCKTEELTLEIEKKSGEIEIIELEKDFDEDLGIIFESAVFDRIKPCLNKCIFCFVDQQPKGLRESLYIKDDDYRLSYLQGTYITLTNLSDNDKARIESQGLGPFYISVHTTNPELRVKMLKNPKAAEVMEHLRWLDERFIPMHLQIVLCPKYNDGAELRRTLNDFKELNNVLSIAVVPVGITKFREGLNPEGDKLYPVTSEVAKETIEIIEEFNKAKGENIACCSDEFFLLAEKEIPQDEYYGEYLQLEDGVGAIRILLDDFKMREANIPSRIEVEKNILFITSKLAQGAMKKISDRLNMVEKFSSRVVSVKSKYWGEDITVAGLITSGDLIETIKLENIEKNTTIVIPSVMLRQLTEDFLDGKTLSDVKKETGLDFLVINDFYSTKEIVDFLNN